MRYPTRLITAILLSAAHPGLAALEYPNDLARWAVTNAPQDGDGRWWTAQNDAGHDWFVYLRAGRPSARLLSRNEHRPPPLPFGIEAGTYKEGLAGKRLNVKVEDGWIVSFNGGEFGGGLWWFSPDGSHRYKLSSDCWINKFLPTDVGLLALEGISHGLPSQGRILRLLRDGDGRWVSKTFLPLGESPYAAAKDGDGTLIVITEYSLLRVHPATKRVEVLMKEGFWNGLYPNSLTLSQGVVYAGMRHGVARFARVGKSYRVEWLLPIPEFDRVSNSRKGFR